MLAALGTQPSAACVSGCTVTCAGYSPRGVPEHNSGLFKPKQASKQGTRALCLQPPGCRRAFFPHLAATCTRSGVERKPPPPCTHPPPTSTSPVLCRRPQISIPLPRLPLLSTRPFNLASGGEAVVSFPSTFICLPRDRGRQQIRAGKASSLSAAAHRDL